MEDLDDIHLQAMALFKGFITEFMPPCGLHIILAHHRSLYKFMYDVINNRGQDHMIPEALRTIDCGYLRSVFQEVVFVSL